VRVCDAVLRLDREGHAGERLYAMHGLSTLQGLRAFCASQKRSKSVNKRPSFSSLHKRIIQTADDLCIGPRRLIITILTVVGRRVILTRLVHSSRVRNFPPTPEHIL
jgi:hypothetical protein